MHGAEASDFFSIVPNNENTNEMTDQNSQDLLNGNLVENSFGTTGRTTLLKKARRGLDNVRSQPWSGAAADILQVTGLNRILVNRGGISIRFVGLTFPIQILTFGDKRIGFWTFACQ